MTSIEPTIKEALATLRLRWDGDVMDFESERRAIIEVTNGVGELLLPRGRPGEKGDSGEPGPGLAPDGVVSYANDADAFAALPDDLGPLDRGYCVLNDDTKTAFFWSGTQWLTVHDVVGLEGPQGPPVGFVVGSVSTSPSGSSAQVSIDPASTATTKILNFVLPRGPKGAVGVGQVGPAGDALSGASDVLWPDGGPEDGQVLQWDSTLNKAVWVSMNSGPVGPFSAGPNEFAAINDSSWPQDYKIVTTVNIPAMDFRWRPRVAGYCDVKVNGIMIRVDLEARLGSASGPVIGRGPGTTVSGFLENYTTRTVISTFEGPMTPENTAATVPAGETTTIYLVLRRIDSLSTFGVETRKDRASFAVWCDPIPGSL